MNTIVAKRNINADLLKVISSFAVVGIHVFSFEYHNAVITYLHCLCYFAVPVFFMVNGYFTLNKPEVTLKYSLRKIRNILLVVFLWNCLIALATLLYKHTLINVFLLSAKTLIQLGNLSHFWFFGAMIIIYMLAPIIHRIKNKYRHGVIVMITVCLFVCLLIWFTSFILKKPVNNVVPQTLRIWSWMFYFILGGKLKRCDFSKNISKRIHGLITLILVFLFPLYDVFAREYINFESPYIDPLAIITNIFIFTYANRIDFDNESKISDYIVKLSSLSMGCYIIHYPIRDFLYQKIGYDYPHLTILFWIGLTILAYIISWILSKLKYINRLIKL